jgi:hypothetical protein
MFSDACAPARQRKTCAASVASVATSPSRRAVSEAASPNRATPSTSRAVVARRLRRSRRSSPPNGSRNTSPSPHRTLARHCGATIRSERGVDGEAGLRCDELSSGKSQTVDSFASQWTLWTSSRHDLDSKAGSIHSKTARQGSTNGAAKLRTSADKGCDPPLSSAPTSSEMPTPARRGSA